MISKCRNRLAKGLQIAHTHMSNLQLVSQYLTLLGNLALSLHDTVQAREILRSSLTLAKKLSDIPTQLWVLSSFTGFYYYSCSVVTECSFRIQTLSKNILILLPQLCISNWVRKGARWRTKNTGRRNGMRCRVD